MMVRISARTRAYQLAMFVLGASLLLLLAATTYSSNRGAAPLGNIDFESGPRGHILVPGRINGSDTGVFALDTGAGSNVIHPRFARQLGLDNGETVDVNGAHSTTSGTKTELASLQVGSLRATDVEALIWDLSHVEGPDMQLDGILGAPFLRQYDVMIDFDAGTIEFFAPQATHEDSGTSFQTVGGGLILFEVTLDEQTLSAVLDTGSGRSAINHAAARALGVALPAVPTPQATSPSAGHHPVAAIAEARLELADTALTSVDPVAVIDLPVFENLGLADEPAMILGTNFLKQRKLTIAYAAGRLYFVD